MHDDIRLGTILSPPQPPLECCYWVNKWGPRARIIDMCWILNMEKALVHKCEQIGECLSVLIIDWGITLCRRIRVSHVLDHISQSVIFLSMRGLRSWNCSVNAINICHSWSCWRNRSRLRHSCKMHELNLRDIRFKLLNKWHPLNILNMLFWRISIAFTKF